MPMAFVDTMAAANHGCPGKILRILMDFAQIDSQYYVVSFGIQYFDIL